MPMEPRRFERLYGVIGDPLEHSLSPALHNWGFSLGRLPGAYLPFAQKAENLEAVVAAVRVLPFHGLSVTLPHKTAIIRLLDGVSTRAERIGAVNTLYWENGLLLGENTDLEGVLAPLRGRPIAGALVLGGGGAGLAVIAGLVELGVPRITVVVREPAKVGKSFRLHDVDLQPWSRRVELMDDSLDVVINTTPVGMFGHSPEETPMPTEGWERVPPSCTAFDLVYNPLVTRFLREAAEAGLQTQDGLDFFVAQGLAQFRFWTGVQLPSGAARVFLEQVLQSRGGRHETGRPGGRTL